MQEVSGSIPLISTNLLLRAGWSLNIFPGCKQKTVNLNTRGGIAQLGERLHGMQEVSGSIPLISTKFKEPASAGFCFSAFRKPSIMLILRIKKGAAAPF